MAFLAYGIPQNNVKRVFLLLKAAYNAGSHIVSADTIQNTILGCRMSDLGQWFCVFFSSRTKSKAGDGRQAYAIKQPEPLMHFTLCSRNHSDPAAIYLRFDFCYILLNKKLIKCSLKFQYFEDHKYPTYSKDKLHEVKEEWAWSQIFYLRQIF